MGEHADQLHLKCKKVQHWLIKLGGVDFAGEAVIVELLQVVDVDVAVVNMRQPFFEHVVHALQSLACPCQLVKPKLQ